MKALLMAYTEKEKILLISLSCQYKMIENKRTDAATVQQKLTAWEKLSQEYNSQTHIIQGPRPSPQLKKLWSNLKQRKANTELRHEKLLTGGESPAKEQNDPVMEAVNLAAPYMDIMLPCTWDSTATATSERTTEGSIKRLYGGSASSFKRRKNLNCIIDNEASFRIKKIEETIKQQEELHEMKLNVEKENLNLLKENKLLVKAQKTKIEFECELLQLKLEKLKKK
ncbi:hypothetical protein ABEB36_015248 [Hypothenemus hampei]|uniref:Regulatory protein zeste n=1 Tax=Hypothenemus hampei TaxID=57062 RepID=A0ABD1E3K2_HYPHA